MLYSLYRRLFALIASIATLALVGVGALLLLRPDDVEHVGAAAALCAVGLALTIALLLQRRRPASVGALVTSIAALIVTAGLWGTTRATVSGAVGLVTLAALFIIAVVATLVRAEAAEANRTSSID